MNLQQIIEHFHLKGSNSVEIRIIIEDGGAEQKECPKDSKTIETFQAVGNNLYQVSKENQIPDNTEAWGNVNPDENLVDDNRTERFYPQCDLEDISRYCLEKGHTTLSLELSTNDDKKVIYASYFDLDNSENNHHWELNGNVLWPLKEVS